MNSKQNTANLLPNFSFFKSGFLFCLLFLACNRKEESGPKEKNISFYYWKSVFDITDYEKEFIVKLSAKKVFLKFCDVDWNPSTQSAQPIAPVRFKTNVKEFQRLKIIPVIFIANSCLLNIDSFQTDVLAYRIGEFIKSVSRDNHITLSNEVQLDCDWTSSTREKYFRLISKFKQRIKTIQPGMDSVSVTIRLHQVKYMHQTGVPPADKGVLMCYNMGNLKNPATRNSIIEVAEMKKYLDGLDHYPLYIDVALPLFEWQVWFRNSAYQGIIHSNDISMLPFLNNQYVFKADSTIGQYDFKAGDLVRYENSNIETLEKAAKLLKEKLPANHGNALIFYHLDSLTLSKYKPDELEEIYDRLLQ